MITNRLSASNTGTPAIRHISPLQYTVADAVDVIAVLLLGSCEVRCFIEQPITIAMLKDFLRKPNGQQLFVQSTLLHYAIQLKWPILAALAAVIDATVANYCWVIWLMISTDLCIPPESIVTFEELAQFAILNAVENDHLRALYQSFEIFYPASTFVMLFKFLYKTRQCNFTLDSYALLADFISKAKHGDTFINRLLQLAPDELSLFVTMLVTKCLKIGFDSMEHSQQLLDIICGSDNTLYADFIDIATISTIHQIIQFTGIQLNIDKMTKCSITETGEFSESKSEHEHATNKQYEYIRIRDDLIAGNHFNKAIELANLLNMSKDPIVYEQWLHEIRNNKKIDFDMCERCTIQHSISPITTIKFSLHIADQLNYADVFKYTILLKALHTIKKHQLDKNEGIHSDRIEHEMYMSLLRNGQSIEHIELFCSEYFETIMKSERCVLFKTFINLKDLANIDHLAVVSNEPLCKEDVDRLEMIMNRLLDHGDIVQALRMQAIFDYGTLDLHYIVFCMALCEHLVRLYDLSTDQKVMLNDGLKHAASKFNKQKIRARQLSTSSNTSDSSSPDSRMPFMSSIEYSSIAQCGHNRGEEEQDILAAVQVCIFAPKIYSGRS